MADEIKAGAGAEPVADPNTSGTTPPSQASTNPPAKVDLTEIPQFREYQSKNDRERAENAARVSRLESELAQVRAERERAAQERAQAELAQIDSLDPAEQAKILRERLRGVEREREAQAQREQINAQVMNILSDAGIPPSDPRLAQVWALGPTQNTVAVMGRAVAAIQRAEREALQAELAEAKKPRDTKAQTAKEVVQALDAAGVTQTSNGQSVVQNSNPNEETRLKLLAEYRTFAGKGIDNPQYRNFAERLSKMGVTTGDLYRTWS